MRAWRRRHGRAGQSIASKVFPRREIPRLRTTLIQLSWLWLRNQPHSALTRWFEERVRRNGGRMRKTMIVALARKLLVALWKYVTAGVVIDGATVKTA
jgi:transposase